jgi:hypothetical protein
MDSDLISIISQLIDMQSCVAGDSVLIRSPFLEELSLLCTEYLVIMLYERTVILNVDHDQPCDTDTSLVIIHFALPTAKMVEAAIFFIFI